MRQVVQARREYYQHSTKKAEDLTLNLSGMQESLLTPYTAADKSTEHSRSATSDADKAVTETSKISEGLTRIARAIGSESNSGELTAHNELSFAAEDLIVYLNNHVYMAAPFGSYGAGYAGGFGQGSEETAKNDIVNRVKTEIRSVKGAVLNMYVPMPDLLFFRWTNFLISRNFPAPSGGLRVA